jgi:hypothetical protein
MAEDKLCLKVIEKCRTVGSHVPVCRCALPEGHLDVDCLSEATLRMPDWKTKPDALTVTGPVGDNYTLKLPPPLSIVGRADLTTTEGIPATLYLWSNGTVSWGQP